MKHKKKILLVGGEGFLGRQIARRLSSKYDCFSVGLSESMFGGARRDTFIKKNPYKKKIDGEYDVLVHLIDNKVKPEMILKEERKLGNSIRLRAGAHIIVFSSAAVYASPHSDYAQRKKMLEKIYAGYCKKEGFGLTIVRLFNTFGDFQLPYRQGSLIANIFCNYLLKKRVEINDPGAKRDFIYAQDVAASVEKIIKRRHFGLIDAGCGKLMSIEKLINIIKKEVIRGELPIRFTKRRDKTLEIKARRGQRLMLPLTPPGSALKKTFRFYEENLKIIKKHLAL